MFAHNSIPLMRISIIAAVLGADQSSTYQRYSNDIVAGVLS